MNTVVSRDGTRIAYDRAGEGRPLLVVDGALCHRRFGPSGPLAKRLTGDFSVITYDRRGRGESTDTKPYSVEREIEDIEALIQAAGGSAYVYGVSSGGALALEAANMLTGIEKLAVYEAPFVVDDTRSAFPDRLIEDMEALLAAGKNGTAVKSFMRLVGTPGLVVTVMHATPVWRKLKAVAPTLPYDFRAIGDAGSGKPLRPERWHGIKAPTLVMDGGSSPDWIRNSMRQLSETLADHTQYRTLPGQTHMLKPEAVAPELVRFFNS